MWFSSRKWIGGIAAAVAAVVVPAGLASGCVALVAFKTTGSGVVQPGGTVEVFGGEFARGKPVDIHLDGANGPILATQPSPQPSTMTSQFILPVPIPQDISSGPHVLVATQDHYDMNVGIPARAAIYVNTSPPAAPVPADRPTTLLVSEGASWVGYVMVGLGAAVAGLFLAAVATVAAGRRSSRPPAGRVKSS